MTKENDMTQQASETMHPTDDELEAMAARLWKGSVFQDKPQAETSRQAAAMLRACKGGAVKADRKKIARAMAAAGEMRLALAGHVSFDMAARKWDDAAEDAHEAVLSLELAPDARQEGWRAGIEAAMQVADNVITKYAAAVYDNAPVKVFTKDTPSREQNAAKCYCAGEIYEAIRALAEKGPDHD